MKEFNHIIADPAGIHARPAGLLVKEARKFTSTITITKGDKTIDVRRIFGLMALGAKQGDSLIVRVEGADEEQAASAIAAFLKERL